MKLKPYMQSSVCWPQIDFRVFGAFLCLSSYWPNPLHIGLLEASLIHPFFHVLQLQSLETRCVCLPIFTFTLIQFAIHVQILDTRHEVLANRVMEQVLVRPSSYHMDFEETMKNCKPGSNVMRLADEPKHKKEGVLAPLLLLDLKPKSSPTHHRTRPKIVARETEEATTLSLVRSAGPTCLRQHKKLMIQGNRRGRSITNRKGQ